MDHGSRLGTPGERGGSFPRFRPTAATKPPDRPAAQPLTAPVETSGPVPPSSEHTTGTVSRDAPGPPVRVDQAVFTSVRSPMGQGYRLIAASPGVRAEEKAEITRRAPSHASLCETGADAVALLSLPLSSGRFCIASARYAGREHTARGGQRVYTHLALVDPEAFERFNCNPIHVCAALDEAVNGEPMLNAESHLEALALTVPREPPPLVVAASTNERRRRAGIVLPLSLAMLRGEDLLVIGAHDRFDLLYRALISLPLAVRRSLSMTCGLRYSPARQAQLSLIDRDADRTQRAICAPGVHCFDIEAADADALGEKTAYDAWLGFLKRRFEAGRESDLDALTSAITEDASPEALGRIVSICDDTDMVSMADPTSLAELRARYGGFEPSTGVEMFLLERFRELARKRAALLEELAGRED